MNLQGRVAIVTGGASGLGRATVEELVRAGANVAIFDVQEDKAAALAAALGSSALPAAVDVTSEASVAAGIQQVMARFGAIHVCVNCAGVPHAARTVGREDKPFPLDLFVRVVTINLVGTFNVLRLAAAEMVKNAPSGEAQERGVIVNTASAAAFDGQVGQAAYSASKAGIVGMSLPIARDLAEHGIRINAIAPGIFETPMVQGMPSRLQESLASMALFPRRLGQPAEFARLARHIIENPYLNAECIRLDAGTRMSAR
jgi:NAD(P)-dependent dehydrogenase (short-subunit alcohol dehydrogenase family)